MSEYTDLNDMIDVLNIAIAREETEEQFFRRSAKASDHKIASKMFLEIAEEFANLHRSLESRRESLLDTLSELRQMKK